MESKENPKCTHFYFKQLMFTTSQACDSPNYVLHDWILFGPLSQHCLSKGKSAERIASCIRYKWDTHSNRWQLLSAVWTFLPNLGVQWNVKLWTEVCNSLCAENISLQFSHSIPKYWTWMKTNVSPVASYACSKNRLNLQNVALQLSFCFLR